MPGARISIVEDLASVAMHFAAVLAQGGHDTAIYGSGAALRAALAAGPMPDVVLLDLQLPDIDGLDLLESLPGLAASAAVIVVTADGSMPRAVSAIRLGAHDFLVKPVAPERLLTTVANAVTARRLAREVTAARALTVRDHFHGFIGRSPLMQAVYRAIENVAASKATVFITGESGTGKEVAAEAIHRAGGRRDKAFVAVNCGAIPENLLESELFGHVRGAFTGAVENRLGAAAEADGGTLFLDEICEMELKLQVKLLRFLQTGSIQRVGTSEARKVDVRVLCATNRDPAAEVAAGRFREDLFYRLAVIPLDLPPLRARGDDIALLAQAFADRFAAEEGRTLAPLDDDVIAALLTRAWPGNVRELQNALRRAVVMARGPRLTVADIGGGAAPRPPANVAVPTTTGEGLSFEGLTLDAIERLAIEQAVARAGGSLPEAARALGVSPSTLYRKRERWAAG
ncbi:AAA family ATPase [alpha proteobacterium AAP81b]|nr:AAA family ATPase [alpha proteobacterium AAP81b]